MIASSVRYGRNRCSIRNRGFTLIELAVALFIVTLLLGSILIPLASQVEQRQISETQKKHDEIREALIGFAVANGHLPCPAVSANNGQESARAAGVCAARVGFLPWQALGVSNSDAWGRLYRYSVTPAFTNNSTAPTPAFTTATTADIAVNTRDNTGALANLASAGAVPAIIISHGRNGYGATSEQGIAAGAPPGGWGAHADENSNATGSTTFVNRTQQAPGTSGAGGEFDDIVTWLPRYILISRMISAGKIP